MSEDMLAELLEACESAERLAAHVDDNPLAHVRWTVPQVALHESTAKRVLLRTGNQFGKTWAAIAEAIYRCTGKHPRKVVPKPPIRAYIICATKEQSLEIQAKIWQLAPKGELHPDTYYDPVKGFRGKPPAVRFANGSILLVRTSRQGGLSLAGGTLDLIIADEPFETPRIYGELDKRLMRRGGTMILSLTPINAPCGWLRELCERGQVEDLHFRMEPENFIPVGERRPLTTEDGVPMDAAWIEAERRKALSWEEPVVCDGEWDFRIAERVFENFNSSHVIKQLLRSPVGPRVRVPSSLGVDHGEDKLRQCGALVLVDETGPRPRVWIVGEYAPETATTTEMDAAGLIEALAGAGMRWSDLEHAYGDKRYTDAKGRLTLKSNTLLLQAIEQKMGTKRGIRPIIKSAKKGPGAGRGAVYTSLKWLAERMIEPGGFYIDERCEWLIECLNNWDGTEQSKYKDGIDAIFYALRPWAIAKLRQKNARPRVSRR